MIKWFHHLLNPHCPDCREEREESRICNSCEVLKMECARLQIENDKLLNRILEKPTPEPVPDTSDLKPINSGLHKTWNVRRQMLEQEDRKAAQLRKEAAQNSPTIQELEKEMDIIHEEKTS